VQQHHVTPKPDFLILGAPKCGTTSVYHYLLQHPNVFLCPKETHYFVCEDAGYTNVQTRSWDAYSDLFRGAAEGQIRGEVAVRYLYSRNALNQIRERLPECRLVVFLREPVSRTISQYLMRFRTGGSQASDGGVLPSDGDTRDFFEDLNHDIIDWSMYHQHLAAWYKAFPGQVRVFLLEQLEAAPDKTMAELCDFVGLDSSCRIDSNVRYNVSTVKDFNPFLVRLKRVQLLRKIRTSRMLRAVARVAVPRALRDRLIWRSEKSGAHISEKISIPQDVLLRLRQHFETERPQLQELTGLDFSEWDQKQPEDS